MLGEWTAENSASGHQPPSTTTEGLVLHPEQTPGPGCRAYLLRKGGTVIVLLAGGNKRTRARDIEVTLKPCALPAAASRDQNQNDPWKTQNYVETAEARLHEGLLDEGATWTCRARRLSRCRLPLQC